MIIPELILAVILTFGLGSYVGLEAGKKQSKPVELKSKGDPSVWPPSNHVKLMKMCGFVCGQEKVRSYNASYGKCICFSKNKRIKK